MVNNAEALAFQARQRAAATEALERLPSTVSIGHHEFALSVVSGLVTNSQNVFGQCHLGAFTIEISDSLPSPTKAAETVTHEILHALWWNYCVYDDDKEERIVSKLGGALTDLWLRNPALLDWIRKTLHGESMSEVIARGLPHEMREMPAGWRP